MALLYTNENFPAAAVEALRARGHDVLTSFQAGNANRRVPDDQVVAFASAQGRAVVTHNRQDFRRLHGQNQNHAGILICTSDADNQRLARNVHEAIQAAGGNLAGQLLRIFRGR